MRTIIIITTTLLFMISMAYSTYKKEDTLKNGTVLRLKLAPIDPRSLMQGDYMRLNFALLGKVNKKLLETSKKVSKLILLLDDKNEGEFIRFMDEQNLKNNEIFLNFTYTKNGKNARSKISTTSYFFEEGSGKKYEKAKYGEFRVAKNGEAILVHLLDDKFKLIK